MEFKVLPVSFTGLRWGHPGHKHGRRWQPDKDVPEKLETYRKRLPDIGFEELMDLSSAEETEEFLRRAEEFDAVICVFAELLASVWGTDALARCPAPVIMHGYDNRPGATFADMYGSLNTDGCDVRLALSMDEAVKMMSGLAAQKRLARTRALIIGEAFPTWSQAASPANAQAVGDALGVTIIERSIDDLMALYKDADEDEAQQQAQEWLENADRVESREAVERDIVDIAKVYAAISQMVEETRADAMTINCRKWDEVTMEQFDCFYGPCMSLTELRYQGIPAACEADVCGLMALCALTYVSGLPAFLGNVGQIDPDEDFLAITHAAAAPNMDGSLDELEGYWLSDYQNRGTGCATYCSVPEGQRLTIARFSKYLDTLCFATGTSRASDRHFDIDLDGSVTDFMHNRLVGDHFGVVYGDRTLELEVFADATGIELTRPVGQ